jgi:hypothetical protein
MHRVHLVRRNRRYGPRKETLVATGPQFSHQLEGGARRRRKDCTAARSGEFEAEPEEVSADR